MSAAASSKAAAGGQKTLLPSPLDTWEQQQQRLRGSALSTDLQSNSRRILPLQPAGSSGQRKDVSSTSDADPAQNVRLMLARHNGSSNSRIFDGKMNAMNATYNRQNSSDGGGGGGNDSDDQFSSAVLPGDSFPATDGQLLPLSIDGDDEDDGMGRDPAPGSDEEREILRRLGQSQARMEQIKRMLVTQRGFIVASLRQMAEAGAASTRSTGQSSSSSSSSSQLCQKCAGPVIGNGTHADATNDEKDRTLGSTIRHSAARLNATSRELEPPTPSSSSSPRHANSAGVVECDSGKLCPMCEAAFPEDVDPEAFESHVVEHFCFEEAETIRYVHQVPPATAEEERAVGE